jgi:hypothetical protein
MVMSTTRRTKSAKVKAAIRVRTAPEYDGSTSATEVRIRPHVEVAVTDGFLCFWTDGREVRVGPLSPDQAEKLADDLSYAAVV